MGYSKEVYHAAYKQLQQRTAQAQAASRERKEIIRNTIPEIAEIEAALTKTASSVLQAVIATPQQVSAQIEDLKQKNLTLQKQRSALLEQHGYPPDYLEVHHTCPRCRDTGYIGTKRCTCLETLLQHAAFQALSETISADAFRFDNFSLHYYPDRASGGQPVPKEHMAQVLRYCTQYARKFSLSSDNLLLIGPTGLGKTHLSVAIAYAVTERGFGVVYMPIQRLMDRLETGKFSKNDEGRQRYSDEISHLIACDLLILDDLGTEIYTTFTASVLYNLINTRIVEGRPTILNTNLELTQIEKKYSPRMFSRLLFEYKTLQFYGKDIRFLKRSQESL